jgi:hypothetical protein
LLELLDQHESNTRCQAQIVIADAKYGTTENYVACQQGENAGRKWGRVYIF